MPYIPPDPPSIQQQADAKRVKEAQEFQKKLLDAAQAHREQEEKRERGKR